MTSKNSDNERQLNRSPINDERRGEINEDSAAYHYMQHHDFAPDDFATRGETTPYGGVRVIDELDGSTKTFNSLSEVHDSNWTVDWRSGVRLNDGTILYEGER